MNRTVGNFNGMWVKFVLNSATKRGYAPPSLIVQTEPEEEGNGDSTYHTQVTYNNVYISPGQLAEGETAVLFVGTEPNPSQWSTLDGSEVYINSSDDVVDQYYPLRRLADDEVVADLIFSSSYAA